jgi:hypothetical protein
MMIQETKMIISRLTTAANLTCSRQMGMAGEVEEVEGVVGLEATDRDILEEVAFAHKRMAEIQGRSSKVLKKE